MNNDEVCPRSKLEETRLLKEDPKVLQLREKCKDLFKLLTDKLGVTIDTIKTVGFASDYFYIHVSLYHVWVELRLVVLYQ